MTREFTWIMNQITVNSNIITYKNQIIRVANISSVDLQTIEKGDSPFLLWVGGFSVMGTLIMFSQFSKKPFIEVLPSIALFFFIAIVCFWTNIRQKQKSKRYVLFIQTNAGKTQLFGSTDYSFVKLVRTKIMEVLNNQASAYTFNIDNKTLINNPTGPINITNVNKYEGLSDRDRKFLSGQFEAALQSIQKEINRKGNQQMTSAFDSMKKELKSSQPRRNVLETTWRILSKAGNLAELASTIERAINLF